MNVVNMLVKFRINDYVISLDRENSGLSIDISIMIMSSLGPEISPS